LTALLDASSVTVRFGGLTAVDHANLRVDRGQIVGLIGPNGAGKTTFLSAISGFVKYEGDITLDGGSIAGLEPNAIARRGLVRTFQIVQPLSNLTVLENVMVGAYAHLGTLQRKEAEERAMETIEFTGLAEVAGRLAGQLTLAGRKRLEVARALALKPKVLLLDEVIAGLNPAETEKAVGLIGSIRDRGVSVVMVEHVMRAIMSLSDRIIVLHYGRKIAEGSPSDIVNNEEAVRAYLGESHAAS